MNRVLEAVELLHRIMHSDIVGTVRDEDGVFWIQGDDESEPVRVDEMGDVVERLDRLGLRAIDEERP